MITTKIFPSRLGYNKSGELIYEFRCAQTVYHDLARCLCAKYIWKAPWIKRIKYENNYDHIKITVYEDNGNKQIYLLDEGF